MPSPSQTIHKFARPKYFKAVARPLFLGATFLAFLCWIVGLYLGLVESPPDYQQKDTVRIMYVHVPAAWFSLFIYTSMAGAGAVYLIWKHMLAALYIRAAVTLGAAFTLICLITGAIWGEPTWGTWWVWDARLTSVLILLFLYIGVMVILESFDHPDSGLQAASWLTIIGSVNIPIIKFSVEWWNTLHQGPSISSIERIADPALDTAFLQPLIVMTLAYFFTYLAVVTMRLDQELRLRKLYIAGAGTE